MTRSVLARTSLLALIALDVATVTSFVPAANRQCPSTMLGSTVTAKMVDVGTLKRRDIQEELNRLGVSYHDCFDMESLANRLVEAREDKAMRNSGSGVNSPPAYVSVESAVKAEEKIAELRAMSLKDLKLQCSRRNIRYYKFLEKEDFVQAVWTDMKEALAFSVTGVVRPGMVADVTGDQLDQEMTRADSLILVDVYATWCGPCMMVVPQLEGAAKQLLNKARVFKLDSDENAKWAGRYQVQGLPTLLLIKNGIVVDRLEGAHMMDSIVEFVQKHQ
jgi:thioredoxin 1